MVNQKELQEKILAYRILQVRLEGAMKQRDLIASRIFELQNTLASLEEVEKAGEDMLFSLGSEAHAFGKLTNKEKVIVEVGANIAIEKTLEEGKNTLNKRKDEFEKALREVEVEISQLSDTIEEMTPEIQDMIQKSQQQAD